MNAKTRRISLTGIDGTGKTTIVNELRRRWEAEPAYAQVFRAPQFHESLGVPHAPLSADIDRLSVLADRQGDVRLKAMSLFLSMTLYGEVERYFEETFHPRFLVGERQPLLDSLVYSIFYAKLLDGPLARVALLPELLREIGKDGLERLDGWMRVLSRRDPELRGGIDAFWLLPLYAKKLFELPVSGLLRRLTTLYGVREPEEIILIRVAQPGLQERLRLKRGAGTERELHEKGGVLEQLQKGLMAALTPIREAYPGVRIHEIDTTLKSVEQTCDAVTEILRG
jgi:hypothetical protein